MDFTSSTIAILISGLFIIIAELKPVASIGINYGQIGNNLPPPSEVIPLIKSIGATKVKLYDADPRVLKAFANTGLEFMVGLGNEYLAKMQDPNKAQAWIKSNIQPHLPNTKITSIFVGNEVLTFNDTSLTNNLLPAMQSVHTALVNLNLDKQISVTTTHSLGVLEASYPPSAGKFRSDLTSCITAILNFHAKTGSPFLINAYPYFAYKGDPKRVSLDFVLFEGSDEGIVDGETNLKYDNMLFAQMDAVYSALGRLGFGKVAVHISETGWPSKGVGDEAGATAENARKYNGNLIKLIGGDKNNGKRGTPMKPNNDLNIYVFALFNENLKPGPTSERNYGLFNPDGTPAYSLGLSGSGVGTNSSSSSSTSSSPAESSAPEDDSSGATPTTSSTGYMSISSAQGRHNLFWPVCFLLPWAWMKLLIFFEL